MTKKHFQAIAELFAGRLAEEDNPARREILLNLAKDFSLLFSRENPRFDPGRFFAAIREAEKEKRQ